MIKWLKSRGFTDRLYFLNLILAWLFIIVCVILQIVAITHDYVSLDICIYGIPAIFAELSIHSGFVIWKAKHENINKHRFDDFEEEEDDTVYPDS